MRKKYFTRLLQTSLMCCLAVLFTACDDMFATEDNPTSAYLGMSEKPVTIKVGEPFQRQAIAAGTAVIEYSSSDTKVATVDNTGLVTAIAEGETTITATATGYSSQTGKKIYLPDSKSYKLTVKPATLPAATITTPPVATTGDIIAGSATALVTAGVADGGTMMYLVTAANEAKPTSTDGFSADIPSASNRAAGTYSVWYYVKADDKHNNSEIAGPVAVTLVVAATITTAPVATTGDIIAGSATALVTAGVADGGTMMYRVTAANEAKPTSTDGFSADIPSASNRTKGTYSVWYYAKGDDKHNNSEIAGPVAVTLLEKTVVVESVTMGSYKCAKVYTSATNGYYIMCTDHSTSGNWSTANGYSVTAGGKTFTIGSKEQWTAIMTACGGTGYNCINTKCSSVTGWSNMGTKNYWSSTSGSISSTAWAIKANGWGQFDPNPYSPENFHTRLISAF